MEDHTVAEHHPFFLGDGGHQIVLDLHGVGMDGEAEAATHAPHMCIDGDAGTPKQLPRMTLAVFRPMPGNCTSSSRVCGTSPANSSTTRGADAWMLFGLARKKPVDWMSVSSARGSASAKA